MPPAAKPAGAACLTCPAREGTCVLPEPATRGARLAIVGESPGRNELAQGRPFVGASGKMLMRGLRYALGMRRDQVHWTNAVLCDCHPKDLPRARKACAERLRTELRDVRAPVVMPVGALGLHSTLALSRKPQILRWRGSVTPVDEALGIVEASRAVAHVCPTIHPAFVMRSPKWATTLEGDVDRVGRVLRNGFIPPEEDPSRRVIVARMRETLTAGLQDIAGSDVAFDVETVGLGPTETALVCFALSDGIVTVVVPWARDRAGSEQWWPGAAAGAVREEVSAFMRSRVIVTHNGPAFDHVVARRYGLEIDRWDDTILATHAVAGHMPKGLSHVVQSRLDVTAWKEQEDRNADLPRLWVYNARDTLYTALAWQALKKEIGQ